VLGAGEVEKWTDNGIYGKLWYCRLPRGTSIVLVGGGKARQWVEGGSSGDEEGKQLLVEVGRSRSARNNVVVTENGIVY